MKRYEEFRKLRAAMEISKEDLARLLATSKWKIGAWEAGREPIPMLIMQFMRNKGKP